MYKQNHEKTPVNALIIGVPNSVVKSSNKGGQFTLSTLLPCTLPPIQHHSFLETYPFDSSGEQNYLLNQLSDLSKEKFDLIVILCSTFRFTENDGVNLE